MENKLLFALLLIFVSCSTGQESDEDSGELSPLTMTTNSGEDVVEVVYPCSVDDQDCIREYFASTNRCTRKSHSDGDPIYRDIQVAYLPSFNCTVISVDDTINAMETAIEKFYVNKRTGNLVIAVNAGRLNINSPTAHWVISRRGEEPMDTVSAVNVTYSAVLTAIIPYEGKRGLAGSSVSSYNTNPYPPFFIGPEISASDNEDIQAFFNALVSDIPTAVQELFLTKAPYFFYTYLQEYLCDFGYEYTGDMSV